MRALFTAIFVAGLAAMQATPPRAAFSVAYYEVSPADRDRAVAAITPYRAASRSEAGAATLEVFEQVGRSGHLVAVESWATEKALATHETGAAAMRLGAQLKPML